MFVVRNDNTSRTVMGSFFWTTRIRTEFTSQQHTVFSQMGKTSVVVDSSEYFSKSFARAFRNGFPFVEVLGLTSCPCCQVQGRDRFNKKPANSKRYPVNKIWPRFWRNDQRHLSEKARWLQKSCNPKKNRERSASNSTRDTRGLTWRSLSAFPPSQPSTMGICAGGYTLALHHNLLCLSTYTPLLPRGGFCVRACNHKPQQHQQ